MNILEELEKNAKEAHKEAHDTFNLNIKIETKESYDAYVNAREKAYAATKAVIAYNNYQNKLNQQ
jgi:hypothetical protein